MQQSPFIQGLMDIVGEEYVIRHPEDLLVYEYDGSVDRSMPRAVALPENAEQVSRILALCLRGGGAGGGTGIGDGTERRSAGCAGGHPDCLHPHEPHPGGGHGEPHRHHRAGGNQPGPGHIRPQVRHAVRTGPVQPESMQPGGEHRRERRGAALPGLRRHHQPRPGDGGGTGETGPRCTWAARPGKSPGTTCGACSWGRRAPSASPPGSRCGCCPCRKRSRPSWASSQDIDSACSAVSAVIGHGIVPAALEMIDALSIKRGAERHRRRLPRRPRGGAAD